MATSYVYSGATGTGTGASWANAYTTLGAAFTGGTNGDTFFVAHDHAQTQASTCNLEHGSASAPSTILCVNRSGSVPPVSADLRTTATITTTSANPVWINGFSYYYGITFAAATGANNLGVAIGNSGNPCGLRFESCAINKNSTNNASSDAFKIGSGGVMVNVTLRNTTIGLGGSGFDNIGISRSARVLWQNTVTPITGTIPATFFVVDGSGSLDMEGLDFSSAGYASSTFFSYSNNAQLTLKNCKLNAGLTIVTPTVWSTVYNVYSDSSGTNYRSEKYSYQGKQVAETTIVRTGGASDGTTPLSWKIVTTANSNFAFPFESIPIDQWNDTTASNVTVAVYGIWGGGSVPNNDDIWIEVTYMGSSGSPIATINRANSKADFLATGSAQGSDSSTWGGSTTKFKMAVTLSSPQPGMKGPISVIVKAAKASSTFYIDPLVVLS